MSRGGMRSKLEDGYLAAPLHGHTRYHATSYSRCPDHKRHVAIHLDGEEIIAGCYYNSQLKAALFPRGARHERRVEEGMAFMDDTAVWFGIFDQQSFYRVSSTFDNQSIEKSLASGGMLVHIPAILGRKVRKRRLEEIRQGIEGEEKTFREFLAVRAAAEGMATKGEREG